MKSRTYKEQLEYARKIISTWPQWKRDTLNRAFLSKNEREVKNEKEVS